ncbi:MAG: hypothetical protein ABJE47_08645 [bacterium]
MPVVRHITGGSLFVYQGQHSVFTLESTDLAIHFQLGDLGSIPMPAETSQGMALDVSATLAGDQTLSFGAVDFNGQLRPKLWFAGMLRIHATPFVVPANTPHPIHHNTHFTMDGNLLAYTSSPTADDPGPPVFNYQLTGHGTVTVRMSPFIPSSRSVTSYFYSFT